MRAIRELDSASEQLARLPVFEAGHYLGGERLRIGHERLAKSVSVDRVASFDLAEASLPLAGELRGGEGMFPQGEDNTPALRCRDQGLLLAFDIADLEELLNGRRSCGRCAKP